MEQRRVGAASGMTEVFLGFGCRKIKKNKKKKKKFKNFQNGRTLANRSSAKYDHVFRLKVDLEPAGRDLNADIKSGTVGQPVCR